jgi:hypothetical protein
VTYADYMKKHLDGTTMRAMCSPPCPRRVERLQRRSLRSTVAILRAVRSYLRRQACRRLCAASSASTMRRRLGQSASSPWACVLLLVLATVWATIARRQARTATNTCDKDTVTASMMANAEKHMSGVELVWTERGERLHMSRECPALNSHLRGKAVCRLCARDNKLS